MPVASPYPLTGAACPGPACPHRGLPDPRPPIAGGNKQRTLERSWRPHGSAGAATGGGQASVTVWSLAEQSGAQGSPAQGRVLVAGLFHRIGVVVIRQPVHGGRERPPQAAHTLSGVALHSAKPLRKRPHATSARTSESLLRACAQGSCQNEGGTGGRVPNLPGSCGLTLREERQLCRTRRRASPEEVKTRRQRLGPLAKPKSSCGVRKKKNNQLFRRLTLTHSCLCPP